MFKIPNTSDNYQLLVVTTTPGAGRLEQSHRLVRGGCVSSGAHRPEGAVPGGQLQKSSIPTKNWWLRLGDTMGIDVHRI